MRRLIARSKGGTCSDEGAYAILYAVLAVVLVAMGAIVVDFAEVRQHRRLDRSATDAAAIAGAPFLNNVSGTGASAKQACLASWKYISLTLNVTTPAAACTAFNSYDTAATVAAYCASAGGAPAEVTDTRAVTLPNGTGDVTIKVAWPVPYHPGGTISDFLTPDLAPGSAAQNFDVSVDGSEAGCDRLGVAILQQEKFGLGGALGATGTQTQVHSVARFDASSGPLKTVAALNILNIGECNVLDDSGGGKVLVDPVVQEGVVVGPGTIAVESSGTAGSADYVSNCQGNKKVLNTGGSGQVCASSVIITSSVNCDGLGVIQLHEMDDGVNNNGSTLSASASCPGDQLCPKPQAENGTYRWNPVTEIYGCNTTVLNPCTTPATNYVEALESAFGGNGTPSDYISSSPYVNNYAGSGWTTIQGAGCSVGGQTILTAGNYYFNCNGLSVTGTLVIAGGNVVVKNGDLSIGNSGCFVLNAALTAAQVAGNCASVTSNGSVTGTGTRVTTNPAPLHDGILYLRGGSIDTSGRMIMPQVFTYSKASRLNIGGGPLTLWTAPGAGALNGNNRTTLKEDCWDFGANALSDACMASRFSRLVYWSDAKAVAGGNSENKFVAQGTLNLVGVFFTPRGSFHFGGGNCLSATSAQYWADDLTVEGGACVTLKPDKEFSEERPSGLVRLIR